MKKYRKNIAVTILALFLGIIFLGPLFAGNTATFSVSCYMPYYVTLSDGEKVLAESEKAKQDTSIAENKKEESFIAENKNNENKNNFIKQKEEIVSKDKKEVQLITTVCAK